MANSKRGTRVATALDNMLAGRQRRKILVQVSGRAAEQWQDLVQKGAALDLTADDVAALLLNLGYAAFAKELDAKADAKAKSKAKDHAKDQAQAAATAR